MDLKSILVHLETALKDIQNEDTATVRQQGINLNS